MAKRKTKASRTFPHTTLLFTLHLSLASDARHTCPCLGPRARKLDSSPSAFLSFHFRESRGPSRLAPPQAHLFSSSLHNTSLLLRSHPSDRELQRCERRAHALSSPSHPRSSPFFHLAVVVPLCRRTRRSTDANALGYGKKGLARPPTAHRALEALTCTRGSEEVEVPLKPNESLQFEGLFLAPFSINSSVTLFA